MKKRPWGLGSQVSLIPGLPGPDEVAVLCLLHPCSLPTTKCCFAAPSQKLRRTVIKLGLESDILLKTHCTKLSNEIFLI